MIRLFERSDRVSAAVNPPAKVLGVDNAVLTGTSRRYFVPDFEGPLSIKTVVAGSAVWEAEGRRFTVLENSYLVLNDRQRYTITIDATRSVTTFCVFFERGFVEDVWRATVSSTALLLDAPQPARAEPIHFFERLETHPSPVLERLRALQRRILEAGTSGAAFEDEFVRVAEGLVGAERRSRSAIDRLPAARAGTREELYRRVLRGRDYLLSCADRTVRLRDAARAACLSPYHFHRVFTSAFGQTPHQHLTRYRLERAAHLLASTSRSVTEICLESGFDSLGSFSSLFRRRFHVSPSRFRVASSARV